MKNVAIFLCTLYFVSYMVDGSHDIVLQCINQAGSTLAEVPSLFSNNNEETIRKRGCIEACLLEQLGYMNGNNINIQYIDQRAREVIPDNESRDEILQSVHQCADNAADGDKCMVAQRFLRCNLNRVQQSFREIMGNLISQINTSNLGFYLFDQ